MKEKEGEQASFEQRLRAEAALEAARKLAAARAEEAERRHVGERDNTAELARAAELAEKWSKNSREKERRRAEIYAINAVMRCGSFKLDVGLSPALRVGFEVDVWARSYKRCCKLSSVYGWTWKYSKFFTWHSFILCKGVATN